jgi:hypothetical protein
MVDRLLEKARMAMGRPDREPDLDADPIDYVRGDDEPRIRRERPVPPRGDRALWVSVASLLITAGGIIFWTGRFTAQAESVQRIQSEQADAIRESGAANARQDVTLGIIGQQYGEITRRLNSIEQKVDTRP